MCMTAISPRVAIHKFCANVLKNIETHLMDAHFCDYCACVVREIILNQCV